MKCLSSRAGHSVALSYSLFLSLIHISEPTRPLYISYAVFCLKKKTCPDAPKVEVKRNSKNIYMLHCWKNYIFNLNKKGVNTRYLVYVSSLKKDSFKITKIILIISRRPRWLSRLSSCLLKSIERVQFSPSAHTRRDFFLHKKMISGKRESVSQQHSMKIDEQWECWALCAIKIEGTCRGGEGTTPVTTACPEDRWG